MIKITHFCILFFFYSACALTVFQNLNPGGMYFYAVQCNDSQTITSGFKVPPNDTVSTAMLLKARCTRGNMQ